jgi:hypothetical protein
VLRLRNPLEARLVFLAKGPVTLQPGGEALISVDRGKPIGAKVVTVKENKGSTEVEVNITDPAGSFLVMAPAAFRLVREFADPVYQVDEDVLLRADDGNVEILTAIQGHATRHGVEVLQTEAGLAIVRSRDGAVQDEVQLVVERLDGEGLSTLTDGTSVEIEGQ